LLDKFYSSHSYSYKQVSTKPRASCYIESAEYSTTTKRDTDYELSKVKVYESHINKLFSSVF